MKSKFWCAFKSVFLFLSFIPLLPGINLSKCLYFFRFSLSLFSSNDHVKSNGNQKKETDRKWSISYPDTFSPSFISTISFFLVGSLSADRENQMTPGINDLPDPSVCSCFPTSYQNMICTKIKWSTISISTALILIVNKWNLHVYLLLFLCM